MTTVDPQLTLLTNAEVYAPEYLGRQCLLVAAGKIIYLGTREPSVDPLLEMETIDLDGALLMPGLIDAHCHITGGGGESGPASRVPTPALSSYTTAGVTSVVGVLGTDDLTRNTQTLVTQVYGLREEGLSAWCYTGGYHLPLMTLTGCPRSDIVNIDPVVGIGEVAISDHRSSQPSSAEIARLAADAHVAGLMTGKAGILHLHLGDGERGLSMVRDILADTELPSRVFHPTHVNRNKPLFGEACELVRDQGCVIDVTAFPEGSVAPGYSAADAIARYLDEDLPKDKLTISSDGGGCLPDFDTNGELLRMDVGRCHILLDTLRTLQVNHVELASALPFFTRNVAQLLRLSRKGQIAIGMDADLLVTTAELEVRYVMARGQWHILEGKQVRRGQFE